jgi:hypothetical protein
VSVLVDTNILLYAANRDSPEHRRARAFLDTLLTAAAPFYLTWAICYEFLRVSTHGRVFARPLKAGQALGFVASLLAAPNAELLVAGERHLEVLRDVIREIGEPAGNIFHDLATAVLAREHGVGEIATADTDFHRFRFLKVTDPVHG